MIIDFVALVKISAHGMHIHVSFSNEHKSMAFSFVRCFVALFFLVILGNILNGKIGYYGQYNDRALKFFATFGLGQERVQNLAVLFVL